MIVSAFFVDSLGREAQRLDFLGRKGQRAGQEESRKDHESEFHPFLLKNIRESLFKTTYEFSEEKARPFLINLAQRLALIGKLC